MDAFVFSLALPAFHLSKQARAREELFLRRLVLYLLRLALTLSLEDLPVLFVATLDGAIYVRLPGFCYAMIAFLQSYSFSILSTYQYLIIF